MSEYPDDATDASKPKVGAGKTEKLTGAAEGGTDMQAGEDDGGAPSDGKDDHVKPDQKPTEK